MHQAIRQHLSIAYAISLGIVTVFVSLLQPIPSASAQQLTSPVIGLSPTSLSFTAQQGGANPAPQTLAIMNKGGGTVRWAVSHDAAWLWHTPGTGTGTGAVSIGATTGTLTPGTYRAHVSLWPTGAPSVTVPVTFTVTPAPLPPVIGMSPTSLSFTAQQGGANPAPQTLAIMNKGGGTLTWSVSDTTSWVAPSPASGTGNGGATISVTTGLLKAGTYSGAVTLSATGAPSVMVPVTFTVTPAPLPPVIGMSPTSLSFTAQQGGANPAPQTLAIMNKGGGTVRWAVSHDAAWLWHTPGTGTGTGAVSIGATTGTLTPGTYRAHVSLWPTGAPSVTVPVTFTVTPAPLPPVIGMSPTSLSFTAQQGGANPAPQTLAIMNKGGGTLTWSVSDTTSWVAPSPASGTGNGGATISVTTGLLKAGTYSGAVTLSATGAPSVMVPVTFTVTPAPLPPVIGMSPTSLSFTAQQGGANPAPQTLAIMNKGGGTVRWAVSHDAAWLWHTPGTGTGTGAVSIGATTGTLTPGTYRAHVSLWPTGAPSVTVPVSFTVAAAPVPPAVGASPTALSFAATQGGANPANQTLTIRNTGGGTLNWSASDNAAWLTLSPGTGTGNGTVTLTVATGTLTPATYSGIVTLSGGTGGTPVTVPVSFTVAAAPVPPAVGASPTALSFAATQGGANPANQTLTIRNTGGGTLNWSASDNAAWLTLSPGTGTGNGTVTLTVATGTLTPATYSGIVTLSGGTGGTPVTVPVSFTVAAAPVPPAVGASPTALSFAATQGGANPANQTLTIRNTGGGTLNWSASDNAAWLTLSPGTGTGNGTVTLTVATGALTPATYSGIVTLSGGTGGTPVTVPVSFTVAAAPVPPAVGASPTALSFAATQGGANPANQTLTIRNTGGGTLNWSASDNAAWLTLSPGTGTGNGTVTLTVATGALTPATYSGIVTLSGGTGGTPVTVPVSFTVAAAPVPPAVGASPTALSFAATQGGANPANQTLTIRNTGGGTLNWSASDNAAWLTLSPGTGTGNGTVTLTVATGALTPATYSGIVTLSGGTGGTPVTVPVSFTVAAAPVPPAVGASPTALSFAATQGGANPANQTLTIRNTGGGTLNWSASDNAAWLTLSPGTGTGNGTVTLTVATGALTPATYSGIVTLSGGTGGTPVTVPVSFTVTPAPLPPVIGMSPTSLSFTAQQGGANPAPQTLAIMNKGGGTLTWSVSQTTSWVAPSPASGTGNGGATISVTTGFLKAGTYTGAVTLSATGAPSVTLPVTFTVTPIAGTASTTINLSPSSLNYAATREAANPVNQTIALTNTGGVVNWTVSADASWLTVSPASGSGSSSLTTSVNTAGLAAGTYSGTLTVSTAGSSSKTVAVTLTVNAPANSSATLTWGANTESDLAGYKIYRATSSGGYGAPIAMLQGNVTTYIATGLQVGTTYFFAITAFDSAGNESPFSDEASKSIF